MSRRIMFSVLGAAMMSLPLFFGAAHARAQETARKADLVIGILPEQNVFLQKKRYEPIRAYLAEKLGKTVYFKLLRDYGDIIREIREEKLDGAFFGSLNFILTYNEAGVEIIARPQDANGVSTYRGYIFARKDSGLGVDPAGWKGRSFAFVSKATTAGYLFPLAYLRGRKIKSGEKYFSRTFFVGSHDAAALAVFRREADLGACKDTIFEQLKAKDQAFREAMTVLAVSEAVPSNGLAVRPGLDPRTKSGLRTALLEMHRDPAGKKALVDFGARMFIETALGDYDPVLKMAAQAGLDLRRYPFLSPSALAKPSPGRGKSK